MMSFSESVKTCVTKKYFTISGRATRAEYWWFQLFYWATFCVLFIIGAALENNGGEVFMGIGVVFFLIMLIPNFCARIRRLHDTNHSGWNILWSCIPYLGFIGGIYLLILECTDSDYGENDYGTNPSKTSNEGANTIVENKQTPLLQTNEEETEEITDVDL